MLVHAKNPRGIIYINNMPIYGKETGREPIEVPYDVYEANQECLVDGTYREQYLSERFGGSFPLIAFTYSELRYLPLNTLHKIAKGMSIDYSEIKTRKQLLENIKITLRHGPFN